MNKKCILIFADYYVPGYMAGGPIRSLQSICDAIGHEFDMYLVTRDRDLKSTEQYSDIVMNHWKKVGAINVMYVNATQFSYFAVRRLLDELKPDVVHLNSLMSVRFSFVPLMAIRFISCFKGKVYLSPRGELSKDALKLKSLKKKIYLKVFQSLGFERFIDWIASSDGENNDIVDIFNAPELAVYRIDNLPNFSQWKDGMAREKAKNKNELNMVFFSRIARMKNLDFLLDILKTVDFRVRIDIYGPQEDLSYLNMCKKKAAILPENITARFLGPLHPEKAYDKLKEYDLFVLPTLGENFGQAIWEALASSVPVLISDRTPWKMLKEKRVGWDVSLENPTEIIHILNQVYSMAENEHQLMRNNSRKYALDFVANSSSLHRLKSLYLR